MIEYFFCICKFFILNEIFKFLVILFISLLNLFWLVLVIVVYSFGWIFGMFNNNFEINGNKKSKFRILYK